MLITKLKLHHYFDSHPITVVLSNALRDIINNCESSGHIAEWGLELKGLNITYAPHTAIKSQVIANFIADWIEEQTPLVPAKLEYWTMYFDGYLMLGWAGAGVLLISQAETS